MKNYILKFPDNFLWGSSTASHQVEGNNKNDWSEWEIKNCGTLAAEAASDSSVKNSRTMPSPLQEKIQALAENPENYVSGPACDHYNRYSLDFDLAGQLNHSAHRLSIEWSRVEPEEGAFNHRELDHYRDVVLSLRERGIEPFITLWHFTNPVWIRDKGGWKAGDTVKYFSRYVNKVVKHLKNDVTSWITINEPMVYAASSFLFGRFPAGERNPLSFYLAVRNLIQAHKSAYEAIKSLSPEAEVGIAKNIIYFEAHKDRFVNQLVKKSVDWLWNSYFLDRIKSHQDFIGVNHYFHNRIDFGLNKNENRVLSDMGWELYPEAVYHALKAAAKYNRPVYITENGLADAGDSKRAWYIREVLKHVHRAITGGVDVRGYFYWSLLDNFEWHKGFWPRFGLIEVDYATLERRVRKSAIEYAKIIKDNGIAADNR